MMKPHNYRATVALALFGVFAASLSAQAPVGPERLLNARSEPNNYLTYGGDYLSQRFSGLTQLTPANVRNLGFAWAYQSPQSGTWEATPLVVDGVMYLTQRPNDIVALDAATGRVFWIYHYENVNQGGVCCGANNRGLAVLGDLLYMGTLDAHLIAVDRWSGVQVWSKLIANPKESYSLTLAPLAIKDKIVLGVGGGEFGILGFVAAYDAKTGEEAWRLNSIPGPGEPGHETWESCPADSPTYCDPEAWKHGGGSVWVTGSYDPELNLTYWGLGNAGPDFNPDQRPGDNLYTCSVVALDMNTGKMKWYFQFTPHDGYDFDAVQVPVLADITFHGAPLKAMLWANRNGFFYVFDRQTGKYLLGKPFTKVNWTSGLDANGRPTHTVQPLGKPTYPANQGGTNWYSPSFSPRTKLIYFSSWQNEGQLMSGVPTIFPADGRFFGAAAIGPFVPSALSPDKGIPGAPARPGMRRGAMNNWTDAVGHGEVLAIDPNTGEPKWRYPTYDVSDSGILTTATDLLFTGVREGYLQALDARTGALLWKASLGLQIYSPITYAVNGKQYVAAISGTTLFVFSLP